MCSCFFTASFEPPATLTSGKTNVAKPKHLKTIVQCHNARARKQCSPTSGYGNLDWRFAVLNGSIFPTRENLASSLCSFARPVQPQTASFGQNAFTHRQLGLQICILRVLHSLKRWGHAPKGKPCLGVHLVACSFWLSLVPVSFWATLAFSACPPGSCWSKFLNHVNWSNFLRI